MRTPAFLLAASLLAMLPTLPAQAAEPAAAAAPTPAPVRVVYHFDRDLDQVVHGINNIRNHLDADPQAQIVVVANGKAVTAFKQGTQTPGGYPLELMVEDLQGRGVRFEVCANTLKALALEPKQLIDGLQVVPSGVAEIARLQFREGYAYIKP
ncbi:DsrE family protein [Thermomonas flagellata]|uniref:DsrE family protein n=1 Tax=Thermomonas flagellata TaxID=2888524 RepID=UPI001F043084|nr:DsrE family protein [Thermomonas flagellata]